ncbi:MULTISPECIES: ABC transporter permease [Paenibacillus]|uniref:ABC transporter permease n=1 Tax=Paenibacillus naphthalenovorans TaxID=162209 RepID=A0A0U2VTQ2_9BACL|nr:MULTISPECIES: ABC transporter permease [Paenibacillus]ALS22903.1 ABC transporter permease [Paenibacillus naphthalenovorans]NTZ17499.1 ABC transporter permease [Paenibacillus sp. JMULE4]SDJ71134.1 putative ABC transport system permease protein [Paenibacillus naphthalenovorans]
MLLALTGSLESGMIYAIMALGVYITFRILNFPDLTVDGSFTTGGAIAAVMITGGGSPVIATIAAFFGGLIAGVCTGLLHTKGKINALLAGILMMIALYSINLRIMDKSNIPMLGMDTLLTNVKLLIVLPIAVLVIKLALDWFLRTDIGLALRATGDNPRMIRSFGVNTDNTIIIGVSLSNGLVALSGALIAQYSAFTEITMGVGMIVIGLASVIIGEALFGARTVVRATLAVALGAVVYRLIVALALRVGVEATDMKLMTALIVIIALTLPMIRASMRQKALVRKRAAELDQASSADVARGGGI